MAYEIADRIVSGRKAVAVAGTAEQLLAASTHCYRIDVNADMGNINPVVIGSSNVVAAERAQIGITLIPGNAPKTILINDISKVWVDAITNDDAVCFIYYVSS